MHAAAPAPFSPEDVPILDVRAVCVHFGGIVALDGISFEVATRQIVGLIGPNGAGKTTLFNCLSRLYDPSTGDIRCNGVSILGLPAHQIAEQGIGRTFQNLALFPTLSVRDNVRIGTHVRAGGHMVADALRLPSARARQRRTDAIVDELLHFFGLEAVAASPAGQLPFGTQKRVEFARAMASMPKILLLDEPAAGLNHEEVEELGQCIRRVRHDRGLAILLVEHHMNLLMSVSDKVVGMNFGRKIAEGSPAVVRENPELVKAYLGSA